MMLFFGRSFEIYSNVSIKRPVLLQLNEYETAPNFIQLTQNLASDCLLIYSQVPIKRVGPNKRVEWIFIKLTQNLTSDCFDLHNNL